MPVIKRNAQRFRLVTDKAHHFPPYHIWIGHGTARLRARFIFFHESGKKLKKFEIEKFLVKK